MAGSEFTARSVGVAAACAIGAVISGSSIIINSIGVLMEPISEEFGFGRAEMSGLFVPAAATAALMTPLIGRAVDRWGGRPIVAIGTVAFGLSTMLLAVANGSLIELYVLYGLIGITGTAAGAVAFNKVLSGWFRRRRGIVMALVGSGSAIGASLVPALTQFLIERDGWRSAYLGLGGLVLIVGLPTFLILFRDPPRKPLEEVPAQTELQAAAPTGLTAKQALRMPTLWYIVGAIAINALVGFGLQLHVVALLTDRGLSDNRAISVLSTFGVGGIVGQISSGYLLDRFETPRIALPFFLSALIGLMMLSYGSGMVTLISAGLLLRIGVGAELSMAPYLLARFFGLRSFGEIYGILFLVATIAGGLGPLIMGWCFDATGSYGLALLAFEALMALSVVLIFFLGPYAYAVHPPDEAGSAGHGVPRIAVGLARK